LVCFVVLLFVTLYTVSIEAANDFTEYGLECLADMLLVNTSITMIDLSREPITIVLFCAVSRSFLVFTGNLFKSVESLANALSLNTTVTHLCLDGENCVVFF